MRKLLAIAGFLISVAIAAQPANDNCSTAQSIGSLPTPAACPSGAGSNISVNGTLVGSTPANPYTYQPGCSGTSPNMAVPANDVWYTFVATGYQLNLTLNATFANPNVAIYSGTCGNLLGYGCAVGSNAGSATLTAYNLVIGQTYYIQVSGNSSTSTGTFSMTLNNIKDCNNCLGSAHMTVSPMPVNGGYPPNTTVTFCYKIDSYTQVSANWLHGVQFTFGSGWSLSTLTTTPPPACQSTGYWAWYPNGITNANGTWGPGFYFETVTGQNNPANNFGDNCSGNISAANWNFCISIKTPATCIPGANLSINVNTSGDGESGSWSSAGCAGDPPTTFNAVCGCSPPTMSTTSVTCNGSATGSATATPVGTQSPFTFTWTPTGSNSQSISNVSAGTYTVLVTDKNNCVAQSTVTIAQPTAITLTLTPAAASCGTANGTVTATASGGSPTYQYQINGGGYGASSSFTGLPAGSYTVDVKDIKGCIKTGTVTVTQAPPPTVTVNSGSTCSGGTVALTANGATSYSWSPATGLSATTGSAVTASPSATTVYTVVGTTSSCTASATSTVTVTPNPPVTVNSATICAGQQSATLTANGATNYSWAPSTGLTTTSGSVTVASPAATTVYTVTGSIGTCTNVGTSTVTVNPLPIVTVNTASICMGQQTATLTANGANTYTWIPTTGLSSNTGSVVLANPGTTTPYTVVATDINGCFNGATTTVTVNSLPNITVNSPTVCVGGSVAVIANGGSTYSWSPSPDLSSSTGSNVTATPPATSTYTVTGTDANGCYNSATSTVTVINNPTLTVTPGTNCAGQGSATLTATGASTYTWSPATGLNTTIGATVVASPASTTVYTINGTAATSCTAVATTTVTVNTLPVVTATSNTPCVGTTLNLSAGGATQYGWAGPNSYTATGANQSIANATLAQAGTYTVVGIDNLGCMNTATVNAIVNPLPVVTVTGATVCVGQTINLSCTPNGATYLWYGPAFNSTAQNPSIPNATPAMAGSYGVLVTDGNGCSNGGGAQVVVNPLPVISVNSGAICQGQTSATLTASGANTYSWTPGNGLSSTAAAVVVAQPNSTTVYQVTGTDLNTCSSSATATVTVNIPPVAIAVPKYASGCTPVSVNFKDSTTATGVTCKWNFGDGTQSLSCQTQHYFIGIGGYNVTLTLTDSKGCVGTTTASVNVYPVPDADFDASPQPANILESTVQFYNQSTGAVIATNSWNFGDNSTSSTSMLVNPYHVYGDTGSFAVQLVVVSDHGCTDSVTKVIRVDDEYAMYVPNAFSPNSDGVNEVFKASGGGIDNTTFNLWIYDRWGNQVWYSSDIDEAWDGTTQGKGLAQEDVYVWLIKVHTVKGSKKTLSGTVMLLR